MRKLFWSLLAFILVALTLITLLVTTESGLMLGLKAVNRFSDTKIATIDLKGEIIGEISAKKITINANGINLDITNLVLRYNLFALLWKKVEIDYLNVGSIIGNLNASKEKKKNNSDANSLSLNVKHASIDFVEITPNQNSNPIRAKKIHWQGLVSQKKINLSLSLGPVANFFQSANLSIIGPFAHYTITALIIDKYTKLRGTGSGNLNSMNFLLSSESKRKRRISGTVSLSWKSGFKWKSTLELTNISTKPFLENGPLIHSLKAISSGERDGTLLSLNWQINADTTAGIIQSHGTSTPHSLLADWNIENLFIPSFYSKGSGTINSHGSWNNGKTTGAASLSDVAWQDLRLSRFHANWDGDTSEKIIRLLKITFQDLSNPQLTVESGKINILKTIHKTSPFNIDLELNSDITPVHSLLLNGQLKKERFGYSIHLEKLNLNALLKKWTLKKPASLSIFITQKEARHISYWAQTPFCLVSKNASLCENSTSQGNTWKATLTSRNLPLHNFTQMTNVSLPMDINAKFYKNEHSPTQGEAIITMPKAIVSFSEYGVQTPIPLRNTRLILKLLPKTLTLSSFSHWGKNDFFKLDGSIERPTDDHHRWDNRKINSSIQLSIQDLGFLNTLSDIYDIHTGSMSANIHATGLASSPKLNGDMTLRKSNVEIMMLGNTIEDVHGKINLHDQSFNLNISGKTKTTPITITANGGFQNNLSDFMMSFAINGKNLQLADSPNYKASGDIDVSGDFIQDHLTLKGVVNIPTATIIPPSIQPSATTLPSDVIILGNKKDSGVNASIDILVKLGKKVVVTSKEFYTRLTGELDILKAKNTDSIGKGVIHIEDGRVNALDLDLTVSDDSSISFDNTPLSSPFIHVKIFRKIKLSGFSASSLSDNTELTVGISAIGVYGNLIVTMYSIPITLSQSDILSYLILGHPMSTADAFNLASLLATIGSLSSDNLSSGLNKLMTIKNTLGFSELGVQSNLSLDALGTPYGSDESGFVVGRYLTSKIYVRYISGISTELNLFQLQYLFNPNWSIQLQSGSVESTNVEGIDGLYHFTHFFSSPKKK
jgi:hypothetical protein